MSAWPAERGALLAEVERLRAQVAALQAAARPAVADCADRLARAVDAAAEGIVLTDREGRIERINPAFTRITGYDLDEARGQTPRLLKSGEHSAEFYARLWASISAGQVYSGRVVNRRKDGRCYHAALTIAPLAEPGGEVTGFVGVQRDVTDDIVREAELARAVARASAATRAKSEFLAKMSHELRTPLNAIIGFTELMIEDRQDPPNEKRGRRLEKVHRNARNLLALINEILDLSKVEAGKLALRSEVVDLIALLTECAESVQPLLTAGVRLDVAVSPALRAAPHRCCDPVRVRQIVTNLLSNAAKFTERGGVTLRVEGDAAGVRIAVEDTGIGIAADHAERIFAEFEQVDASTTRRAGGTGLGLAICRKLSRAMGGDVVVASRLGQGACFTLTLPAPVVLDPATAGAAAPAI